jgi:hypothetical protein
LIAAYFCAIGWTTLRVEKPWLWLAVGQLALIAAVCGARTLASYRRSDLPYDHMAEEIRARYLPYVWVVGPEGDGFEVHLRGWTIHGPDTTSGAPVAFYCRPHTQWMLDQLRSDLSNGRIRAIVYAKVHCPATETTLILPPDVAPPGIPQWHLAEVLDGQFCVYTP